MLWNCYNGCGLYFQNSKVAKDWSYEEENNLKVEKVCSITTYVTGNKSVEARSVVVEANSVQEGMTLD